MDVPALYDTDIYAWSQHQARVLRDLAASGAAVPNDLDLAHVAEEIEDVGNALREGMESLWVQAFAHLLKRLALPEDQAARHWLVEADTFLDQAQRRYRPSMQDIRLDKLWRDAARLAGRNLATYGHAVPDWPAECPIDLAELLDARNGAAELLAMLQARV